LSRARRPLLFLVLVALLCGPAHAHAFPEQSIPAVGRSIPKSPPAVAITFDADLEPLFSSITVKRADGQIISQNPSQVGTTNPRLLTAPLPALAPGKYYVYWSVVATDGHRTEGHYPFRIE